MKKSLFLLSVLSASLLFGAEQVPVKNASFEEVDAKGYPVGWSRPGGNVWFSSTENAYEGKRSILYNNPKPGLYKFTTQRIQVKPNTVYDYSCMAKIVRQGKNNKAKPEIFMEFWSKSGKYLGGEYGCEIKPTNTDWFIVSGRAKIPAKDADRVSIGLLVRPAGAANVKVWFDKVEIRKAEVYLLSGALTTNRYRDQAWPEEDGFFRKLTKWLSCSQDQAEQGKVKVFCGIEEGLKPASAAKTVTLAVRQNGKTLFTTAPEQVLPDRLIYSFDSGKLSPGKYELSCSFKDPDTGKVSSVSQPFTKLAEKPSYRCYVDEHHRMILDGKPFFPLGMYCGSLSVKAIDNFKTTKMNCLMAYAPPGRWHNYEKNKYLLDYMQKNNLKLFYSIKDLVSAKAYDDGTATRKIQAKGLNTLKTVKDHPAIIAWYINDELAKSFVKDAIQYRQAVEDADPGRPTWTVLCRPNEFRAFTPASDIHGSDPYPIPNSRPRMALKWTRDHNKAVMGSKMLIQVPQAFCWGRYWLRYGYDKEKCAKCRRPTMEEIDSMSWMCIAGGANGLIYYSYSDIVLRDKATDVLPRIPFESSFGEMRTIASRIMEHEKVLLSAGNPVPFKIVKDGEADVGIRAYELDGTTWILAVNSDEKKSNDLVLEMGRKVSLQGTALSKADVKVSGKTVSVTLKPLQPLFIKLR